MKKINKIRINNFKGMIEMTEKGETLIKKIQRILDENEPLTDGAPMIYTPKQAGVREDCNVRTDKWAVAMAAMDRVNNYKLNEYLKKGEAETYCFRCVSPGSEKKGFRPSSYFLFICLTLPHFFFAVGEFSAFTVEHCQFVPGVVLR